MGTMAVQGQYFIVVDSLNSDVAGDFLLSAPGSPDTVYSPGTTGAIYFGPYAHSGTGGEVQVIVAQSVADPTAIDTEEVPEILCGIVTDNGLNASGPFCNATTDSEVNTGAVLVQSAPGSFMTGGSSGQVQVYLIVRDTFIVQSNMTGLFTGLPSDTFTVYAINYREGEPLPNFLAPGQSVVPVLNGVNATEGDSPLDGACYTVCNTDPAIVIPVNCLSIGSTVFADLDNDATFEMADGEYGIPNVQVDLYTTSVISGLVDSLIATTNTDNNGNYFFGGLPKGDYVVSIPMSPEGLPLNSTNSTPPADNDLADNTDYGLQATPADTTNSPVISLMAQTEPDNTVEMDAGSDQDDNIDGLDGTMSDDEANGNMLVDFGFAPSLSIGSTVFYDVDNSGDQDEDDPLELGIEDVVVILYQDTSAALDGSGYVAVDSTLTDPAGNYLFDTLAPGNYQVAVLTTADAPLPSTGPATSAPGQDDTDVDGNNNGVDYAMVTAMVAAGDTLRSGTIVLSSGDEPTGNAESFQGGEQDDASAMTDANGNMTVDFGFIPVNSLGSTVFFDMDNDGMQDDNTQETGIPGVTLVLLFDADGNGIPETPVDTTMTDADGNYFFGNLPDGVYAVTIPVSPTDANLSSTPNEGGDFENDDLQNGVQAVPGGPVSSGPITLTGGMEPTDLTETNNGNTQDAAFDANGDQTVDFGFVPMLSLGSTVFYDQDDNGMQDLDNPLEYGIAGVEVVLFQDTSALADGSGLVALDTVTTDALGNYYFDMLSPAKYVVAVAAPEDAQTSSTDIATSGLDNQTDLDDNGLQAMAGDTAYSPVIMLMAGDEPAEAAGNPGAGQDDANDLNGDMTVDFSFVPDLSLGSTVFYDPNDDGLQDLSDPLESGIAGVVVELYADLNGDGVAETLVGTDTTDAEGNYFFDQLPAGDYQVVIPTPDEAAPASSTGSTDVVGDATDVDLDDNGQQAASGDQVSSNVFSLTADNQPIEAAGNPGADQDDAADDDGNMTVDFGFVPNLSIGSTVFYDQDGDGFQEAANPLEDGIDSVTLQLALVLQDVNGLDSLVIVATTLTDSLGNYLFDSLPEGNYQVLIPMTPGDAPNSPPGESGLDDNMDGVDDGIQPVAGDTVFSPVIELLAGDEPINEPEQGGDQDQDSDENGNMTVDFGLVPNMSLGSTVFYDMDDNGLQDLDNTQEAGIPDVTVQLLADIDNDGVIDQSEMIETVLTDENGNYLFDSLPAGDYQILIPTPPNGALNSSTDIASSGLDNQTDLDDNGLQAMTGGVVLSPVITLSPGDEPTEAAGNPGADQDDANENNGDMTVDFGFVPMLSLGSTVFYDQDDNGMQDLDNPLEYGIAGVEVVLFQDTSVLADGSGLVALDTVTTDALGNYYFDMLSPAKYVVAVAAPEDAQTSSTDIATSGLDNQTDLDDNGLQAMAGDTAYSPVIMLMAGDEPAEAAGNPGAGQDDANDLNGDMTVDFSFVPDLSLGSTVFYDPNDDGLQDLSDPLESGIAGVVVELYADLNSDGVAETLVGTDTTDAEGNYFFDQLPAGDYQVVIPTSDEAAPASSTGSTDVVGDATDVDLDDNGQQAAIGDQVSSNVFALTADNQPIEAAGNPGADQDDAADDDGNMTVDFGFVPNLSIGSTVFYDQDGDGFQEAANPLEDGIDSVTLQLALVLQDVNGLDSLVIVATTLTDSLGNYLFDSLPEGNYQVIIPMTPGDAPNSPPGESGLDDNMDGVDDGIQPVAGDTVFSPVIELLAGDEPINEPEQGGDQDQDSDENGNMTVDFGLVPNMSLGSTVFYDMDDNGLQDLDNTQEAGIPDVAVQLLADIDNDGVIDQSEVIETVLTDENGNYLFDSLPAGDYQILIPTPPNGALNSSTDIASSGLDNQTDLDDNGLQAMSGGAVLSPVITLSPGDEPTEAAGNPGADQDDANENNGDMTVDFGFVPMLSLGSTVFYDQDDNGMQDLDNPLEYGIAGVEVVLFQDTSVLADGSGLVALDTVTTDALGNYYFDMLSPAKYVVAVAAPEDAQTSSTDIATSGLDNQTDLDDNGLQAMAGDTAYSPVIMLMAGDEPAEAAGNPGAGQDDANDLNGDMTVDFSFVPDLSLGSTVFYDFDDDGVQDAGGPEVGIPGVIIELYADLNNDGVAETLVATDTTDAQGNYFFDALPEGDYQVVIPTPNDDAPTSSTGVVEVMGNATDVDADDNGDQPGGSGTSVNSNVFSLSAGNQPVDAGTEVGQGNDQDEADSDDDGNMTVDFGFVPSFSLGSTVFLDNNNDAMLNGADAGVSGVPVTLYADLTGDGFTADDTIVAMQNTDLNGDYFFDGLAPGDYVVAISPPDSLPLSSNEDIDFDDPEAVAVDNDDNGMQPGGAGATIFSGTVSLGGETAEPLDDQETGQGGDQDNATPLSDATGNMLLDFGLFPGVSVGSTVFLDNDNNGLFDIGEDGIVGVPVILLDAMGTALDTTYTDGLGNYLFDGLTPGNYEIQIPADAFVMGGAFPNGPLQNANLSSEPVIYEGDNQLDGNDNGMQTGAGTVVTSGIFNLDIGAEPTNADPLNPEFGNGSTQDDQYDSNGDMTIDFGFVPVMFDLALIKELADGQEMLVQPGDTIAFTITVFNQGNVAAGTVEVTDSIPDGLTFLPALNPDWMGTAPQLNRTITSFNGLDSLAPDSTVMVDILLRVDVPQDAQVTLTNYAEISDATNQFGMPVNDIDSQADDDLSNDEFLQDNEISGNGNADEDEDDHDIAQVTTVAFDLALRKELSEGQVRNVASGADVSFQITVFNQGMIAADSIVISDLIPEGFTFDPLLNPDWMTGGNADTVKTLIEVGDELPTGGLQPDSAVAVTIILSIDTLLPAGTELRNVAQIESALDNNGNEQFDADSDYNVPEGPDDILDTDDNIINENGTNVGEDEDESDFEFVILQRFDLALRKKLSAGQTASVNPGDTVSFDIILFNQGEINADNIVVSDLIPEELTFIDDMMLNPGWTLDGDTATVTLTAGNQLPADGLAPGGADTVVILLTVNAPLAAGTQIDNVANIIMASDTAGNEQFDADSDYGDLEGPDDIDPLDNDIVSQDGTDPTGDNDEDESDEETLTVNRFDLALRKLLSPGQSNSVAPGDTVSFDIVIINQGEIAADSITVADIVPEFASFDPTLNSTDWSQMADTVTRILSVENGGLEATLQPEGTDTVQIVFVLDVNLPAGTVIRNNATIRAAQDSLGNEQVDDDSDYTDLDETEAGDNDVIDEDGTMPGQDEDETDFAEVAVNAFDLALRKTLSPGQEAEIDPFEDVNFDIIVINQGEIAADSIVIRDYLPENFVLSPNEMVFMDDPATTDPTAFAVFSVANGGLTAPLQPGMSDTFRITMRLNVADPGQLIYRNIAEIEAATDQNGQAVTDVDSEYADPNNPDQIEEEDDNVIVEDGLNNPEEDEDESDFANVISRRFDLALFKVLDQPNMNVNPGDTVSYRIRVINQGTIGADSIEVSDYIPTDGLLFDPTLNPEWDLAEVVPGTDTIRLETLLTDFDGETVLMPGEGVDVFIRLVIPLDVMAGDEIVNTAEISDATGPLGQDVFDVDSPMDTDPTNDIFLQDNEINGNGPAGDDEDNSDPASVFVNAFDLALIKKLSPGQSEMVNPGDTVSYDIILVNQGMITAGSIVVRDIIPTGLTLDESGTFVNDPLTPNTAIDTLIAGTDLPTGGLLPGMTDTVQIRLVVPAPVVGGTSFRNLAEIVSATDENGNPQIDDDSDYNDPNNPDEIDEDDDDDIDGNGQQGGDEDESDFEDIIINDFDLALRKGLSAGQDMLVSPGDTVSYDIIVFNQGDIAADSIVIRDFIPEFTTLDMSGTFTLDALTNTASDTFTVADGDLIAGGLLPGASDTFTVRVVLNAPLPPGLTIRNIAEIESATDQLGNPATDVDSEYADPDNADDIAESDNDDIEGNGLNGGDEDESDFADVITSGFDLALIKTLSEGQSANVEAGDTVSFNIRVINQGMIAADSVRVSDYIPTQADGFLFDPSLNPGWSEYANINDTTYVDTLLTDFNGQMTLAPDSFLDLTIRLVVNPAMEAIMPLTNLAEISGATGENGQPVFDIDSPMDTIPGNDNFFQDNEINDSQVNGGDSDNSDPATIFVGGFDLALEKVLADGQSSTVEPGENVIFEIIVTNQGAIPADNIGLVDYIPDGFLYYDSLNTGFVLLNDSTAVDTLSVAEGTLNEGGLLGGQSTSVFITLTVAPPMFPDFEPGVMVDSNGVESGQTLVNTAEITTATDNEGEMQIDIDSNADGLNDDNDDGNEVDGEVNGGGDLDGDGINDEDEDDSDIAVVTVECYQDAGVSNTIQVCLGCDEAEVVINLFDALSGRPNIGGIFAEGELRFLDDNGDFFDLLDINGNTFGDADFDPVNVVISGELDRSLDYSITYTIPAVNDCPEVTATITIDLVDIQNLSCSGFTNISLGEDCEATITPDLILQGDLTCASSLTVELIDATGNSIGNVVGADQIGQTFFVNLTDEQCNNTCWGQILVEDKRRPTIECAPDTNGVGGKDFICIDIDQILTIQPVTYSAGGTLPAVLNLTGAPVVADNCATQDELTVSFRDLLIPVADPVCEERTILRTFTVSDPSGNTAICVQEITVRAPNLDDVMLPADSIFQVECNTDFPMLPNGNPTPASVGGPSVMTALGTFDIDGNGSFCNLAASFSDGPRIITCENTFKFVRTWTVFDWCNVGDTALTYTQVVKVGDFTAPTFTAPTQDLDFDGSPDDGPLFFSTNTTGCESIFQIPGINAQDNCSATVSVAAVIYLDGDLNGTPLGAYAEGEFVNPGLPVGMHTLRYVAADLCGNADTLDLQIEIADQTAPVAICEDGLNISIASTGTAELCATDVNSASYDDCSDVELAIVRVGLDDQPLPGATYQECITLTCADLGIVRVSLRVTDDGDADGDFDADDNVNYCWLDVLVEDKLAPICVAPAPVTVDCSDLDNDFPQDLEAAFLLDPVGTAALLDGIFGAPTGIDNCDDLSIVQTVVDNRSSCGTGIIQRSFTVTDGAGFVSAPGCSQTITVLSVHDYTIVFPGDQESDDCVEPDYNEVSFTEFGCDLITVSTTIDTFSATADECYKLRITYEVLNWCEYNSLDDAYMIPRDADGDDVLDMDTTVLHVVPNGAGNADDLAYLDRDANRNNFNTIGNLDTGDGGVVAGTDPAGYGQDGSRGAFRYQQFIKVYDDTPPTLVVVAPDSAFCSLSSDCTADVELGFSIEDECSPESVNATVDLDQFIDAGADGIFTLAEFVADQTVSNLLINNGDGTYTLNLANVAIGRHAIRISTTDGCGNNTVELLVFEVEDCKAPTPICINGLTATLMPDGDGGGMAAIWADDFIASDVTDCSGPVQYAIYLDGEQPLNPNPADTGLLLDCSHFGFQLIRVYAIDANGLADYCLTTLDVQVFNGDICEATGGSLAGLITTEFMVPISDVNVSLAGTNGASSTITTTTNGTFLFAGLEGGEDYTVTPAHFTDYMNGVTTGDIVAITRHILGMEDFSSPYQYLAADVDGSEVVNVVDIIAIRRLILGLVDNYPNGQPSWRFVSADYSFPQANNPWAETFPEVNNYNNLLQNVTDSDFIGAKLGDVNNTAVANSFQAPQARELRGDLFLEMDEQQLQGGQTYRVPVRAADLPEVAGYQFTLEVDQLAAELLRIEAGLVQDANFGWRFANQGLITTSWNWEGGLAPDDWSGEAVLFTLVLNAREKVLLSDVLSVSSRFTLAEAYGQQGGLRNVGLIFDLPEVITTGYGLYQNSPNPFERETVIGYELPAAAAVTITVTDVRGRLVRTYERDGQAGYNSLRVTRRQIGSAGVYYYTVSADEWTASKKMILLR